VHNTRCARRQKRCTIRTCLRLSGPLHRTSTSSHGGEATGARNREPYPCPRQRHGSARQGAGYKAGHQAPVAQWIEQAPSKRLAAGSSPAGGASLRPPSGEGFLLVRARSSRYDEAADACPGIRGRLRAVRPSPGFRGWPCRRRAEVLGQRSDASRHLRQVPRHRQSPLRISQPPLRTAGMDHRQRRREAAAQPWAHRPPPTARRLTADG
jgi:hypothetical protein